MKRKDFLKNILIGSTGAYLRIDLSSREIARLMNVTIEATNKGRHCLRKELNLQAKSDLKWFLYSL